jgi:hypothetical protein
MCQLLVLLAVELSFDEILSSVLRIRLKAGEMAIYNSVAK